MLKWIPVWLALVVGCTSTDPSGTEPRGGNERWASEQIRTASIDQAILTQRTVFPYHFHTGSARLNQLGMRDLAVLSRRYQEDTGELSVRRSGAPEELHQARIETVLAFLSEQGIEDQRLVLVDAPPEGAGMAGARLVRILASPGFQGGGAAGTGASGVATGVER